MKRQYIIVLILFLIVLIGLQKIIYEEVRNSSINAVSQENQLFIDVCAKIWQDFFTKISAEMGQLAKSSAVMSVQLEGLEEIFAPTHFQHDGLVESISLIDSHGRIVYTYPEDRSAIGVDLNDKPHIKKLLATRLPVVSDKFLTAQGDAAIALHYPIFKEEVGKEKKFLGAIGYMLPVKRLTKLLPLIPYEPAHRFFILLGANGRIIYSSESELIDKDIGDIFIHSPEYRDFIHYLFTRKSGSATLKAAEIGEKGERVFVDYRGINIFPGQSLYLFSGKREKFILLGMREFNHYLILSTGIIILSAFLFFLRYAKKHRGLLWCEERIEQFAQFGAEMKKRTEELDESIQQTTAKITRIQQSLRSIMDNLLEEFFVVDSEGRIIAANQRLLDNYRLKKEEIIGTSCHLYDFCKIDSMRQDDENCIARQTIQEGKTLRLERTIIATDNSGVDRTKYYEISAIPIYGINKAIEEIIIIRRDVTEKKLLERSLFQAQKMESIGTLAGGIAHDFNNLLSGILGYISLLRSIAADDVRVLKYAEVIEESAQRGIDLVRALLRFSKKSKPQREIVNLNETVEKTIALLQPLASRNIKIKTIFDGDLWKIEADPTELQQVLMNLGVNALEAMPDRGELTFETKNIVLDEEFARSHPEIHPGEYAYLSVSDTGKGIPQEIMDRIFEPFFTTKESGKGTGLGLAVVYGIVKSHKGYIYVYSELGVGTVFKLYFPVARQKLIARDEFTLQPAAPGIQVGGGETILIVDDEQSIRDTTRQTLERLGYKVLEAANGQEAIRLFAENKSAIKAIILDLVMPELDGKTTLPQLSQIDKNIPVILTSGFAEAMAEIDRQREKNNKLLFLQKPYRQEELARILSHALGSI